MCATGRFGFHRKLDSLSELSPAYVNRVRKINGARISIIAPAARVTNTILVLGSRVTAEHAWKTGLVTRVSLMNSLRAVS
jgi:hypothetical protein